MNLLKSLLNLFRTKDTPYTTIPPSLPPKQPSSYAEIESILGMYYLPPLPSNKKHSQWHNGAKSKPLRIPVIPLRKSSLRQQYVIPDTQTRFTFRTAVNAPREHRRMDERRQEFKYINDESWNKFSPPPPVVEGRRGGVGSRR